MRRLKRLSLVAGLFVLAGLSSASIASAAVPDWVPAQYVKFFQSGLAKGHATAEKPY